MQELTEGTTTFWTNSEERISKEMPVFFNPIMKLNRDLSLAMLLTMPRGVRIGLPLEASGVRAARVLHELVAPGHLSPESVALNDLSPLAVEMAQRNVAHNIGVFDPAKVVISRAEATKFLLDSPGFDYLDVDPFGTPNPFLDAAAKRIHRGGILSVTATDTSALAGTYPAASAKKYWAVPSRTWVMHEVGLRILIRKVQLIGAQYDKALVPVLSVSTDHYYKIFFECKRSHSDVKPMLKQHQHIDVDPAMMRIAVGAGDVGPLWTGPLHDASRIRAMRAALPKLDAKTAAQLDKLLAVFEDECRLDTVGFVDLHELASMRKLPAVRTEVVLERLGPHACRTHINGHSVKTDLPLDEFVRRIS